MKYFSQIMKDIVCETFGEVKELISELSSGDQSWNWVLDDVEMIKINKTKYSI